MQKMVVSLATDKGVWDAVLANDQIKEFRQKLREATGRDFDFSRCIWTVYVIHVFVCYFKGIFNSLDLTIFLFVSYLSSLRFESYLQVY